MVRLVTRHKDFCLPKEIQSVCLHNPNTVDVRLRCKDHRGPDGLGAHRLLLASASPHFLKNVLLDQDSGDENEMVCIHLPDYNAEEVFSVISLLYYGELSFTDMVTLDICTQILRDLGICVAVTYDYEDNLYKLIPANPSSSEKHHNSTTLRGIKREIELHECSYCNFTTPDYNAFTHHSSFCEPPRVSLDVKVEEAPSEKTHPHRGDWPSEREDSKSAFVRSPSKLECDLCDFSTDTSSHLSRHLKEVHKESNSAPAKELLPCSECPSKFSAQDQLQRHAHSPLHAEKHSCSSCSKSYGTQRQLKRHIKSKSCESYRCKTCGKVFAKSQSLAGHVKSAHPEIRHPKTQTCEACGKSFSKKFGLRNHKCGFVNEPRLEEGEKTCDICGKMIALSSLKSHAQYHTGGKKNCHLCKRTFANKSSLERHKLIHFNVKTFKCDVCRKDFAQKSALNTHKRVHTGERYDCSSCRKKFISKSLLNQHFK